jgi:hypothetical protein
MVGEQDTVMEFKDIVIKNDVVYVYSESRALIFRAGSIVMYDGSLPRSTYLLIPGNKVSKFTTVNQNTVDTVILR